MNMHNAYINENCYNRYQMKVYQILYLRPTYFYTMIYMILHLTDDIMVPVLDNKALKFRFYM